MEALTSPLRVRAERSLDALSFLLSDVRYGLGAYLGVYLLTEHGWDAAAVGSVFAVSGLVGVLLQAPLGAMVDVIRAKRSLLAGAVVVATMSVLVVPIMPRLFPVTCAGVVGSIGATIMAP